MSIVNSLLKNSPYCSACEQLARGLRALSPSIPIHGAGAIAEVRRAIRNVTHEYPDIFYVRDFRLALTGFSAVVYPQYSFTSTEVQQISRECEAQAQLILSRLAARHSCYDKVLMLHDILACNMTYQSSDPRVSHTIIGPLLKRNAVCDGFSKTFKYVLDKAKIPCRVVAGTATDHISGTPSGHAWNLVCIDGSWCHIDATFDTTIRNGSEYRYDYFGLTDALISRDHFFTRGEYPRATDTSLSYYERNGLVMQDKQSLKGHLLKGIRSGKRSFVFKLPDTGGRDMQSSVRSVVSDALTEARMGCTWVFSSNSVHNVFYVAIE